MNMVGMLRNISLLALGLCYLAVSSVTLVRQMAPPAGSANPAFLKAEGETKEPPKQVWVPRRHMPMVKEVSIHPSVAEQAYTSQDCPHASFVTCVEQPSLIESYYYSSLSDRAPPLSSPLL
jgi:hypothetical protein